MIDPGTIQEMLDREPFQPFRIAMNSGEAYDAANPSLAVAMESTFFLAMPKRDRFKLLSYQNMSSVESLAPVE